MEWNEDLNLNLNSIKINKKIDNISSAINEIVNSNKIFLWQ